MAKLPSPRTFALLWSPPVAVAVLPSPITIATEPVPSARQDSTAVPFSTRTKPLVATHMFGAAAAVCAPSAARATAATLTRIIDRLCISPPSGGFAHARRACRHVVNGQAQEPSRSPAARSGSTEGLLSRTGELRVHPRCALGTALVVGRQVLVPRGDSWERPGGVRIDILNSIAPDARALIAAGCRRAGRPDRNRDRVAAPQPCRSSALRASKNWKAATCSPRWRCRGRRS